jgi:oligopeptide transport system permease protein
LEQFDAKKFFSFHPDLSVFEPATDEEKRQQSRMRESTSFFRDGMRKLLRDKVSMVCLAILAVIALVAFAVPPFYPYDYFSTSASRNSSATKFLKPFEYSPKEQALMEAGEKVFPHILGTDDLGRDYAARVVYGARISLTVGIIAALIVVVIGVTYGAVSGYLGGRADLFMMRIVDIIYSLPDMLIIILLSISIKDLFNNGPLASSSIAKLGPGLVSIFIVFGLLYWVGMARLVRGQVLALKQQEFVLAAESMGARAPHIIRKHMIPNCVSVIFISAALQIPSAIFTESFLSFMGLGVSIPMPSLGSLASEARGHLISRPYLLLIPALSIFLIILSLNLLGSGMRDAFDPKLKEADK